MKYILTLIVCLINFNILYSQVNTTQLSQTWVKVGQNDPYDGDIITIVDTTINRVTLQFMNNQGFLIIDNSNRKSGKWKWNEDSTKIGTCFLKINDQIFEDSPITDFRMYISLLTNDSLIIGVQGRHGIVRDFFISKNN